MNCKVTFLPENIEVCVPKNATIMDAERLCELGFEYPCGGNGTCNKCMVDVLVNGEHKRVKSCTTFVEDGMIVDLSGSLKEHNEKVLVSNCNCSNTVVPHFDYSVSPAPLGVAFDIGTTTIAAYLIDLCRGTVIDTIGELNNQVKYGGDVISRCIFALQNGVDEISNCVTSQADNIIEKLLKRNNRSKTDVLVVTVVGNTCMHHIFAGINPTTLVEIPYMPTVYEAMEKPAKEIFASVSDSAKCYFAPVIAGFVGADTVACILSTRFYEKESYTLLVDIGTNGEMVLGNKNRYVCCSTASGPAFEGAKIVCGMRGAPGAIDHVKYENDDLSISVIDNIEACGICGSGLIDIVAVLLDAGVIMSSGRFDRKYDGPLSSRICEIEGTKAFKLTDKVFITQKDIREVQLAKGAIAAGIEIMSEKLGITYDDINEVEIAGAFGNYMDPTSSCRIKLLPPELLSKISPVGNAAGDGAKLIALSKDEFEIAKKIARDAEFIELASHENFQEKFIKQLDF